MHTRLGSLVLGTTLAGAMAIFAAGCAKSTDASGPPPATTSIGTEIDDSVITTRVMSALMADSDIKSLDFKVETRKGEVQLSGYADNQAQLDRAIAVTRAVQDVKAVANNMNLKGTARTLGTKVDDGIVTTQVKAALFADEKIKSTDIGVVTRKGEVQLSGFVNNQSQIDRAILVARGVEGVGSVSNEMSIKK